MDGSSKLAAKMAESGFLTVAQLVARTGMTEFSLRRLIYSRKVRAVKVSKFWFVELASLARHLGPEASKLLGVRPTRPPLPPEK